MRVGGFPVGRGRAGSGVIPVADIQRMFASVSRTLHSQAVPINV